VSETAAGVLFHVQDAGYYSDKTFLRMSKMYVISDAEYIRDFTMMLNDDIIDCFTEKGEITIEQKKEIDTVFAEIQASKISSDSFPQTRNPVIVRAKKYRSKRR